MFKYYFVNRIMNKFKCGGSAVDQTKVIVSFLVNYGYYTGELEYKYNYTTSRIEICKRKGFKVIFILLQVLSFITTILVISNLVWLKYTNQLNTRNPIHAFHTFIGFIIFFTECCHGFNITYAHESIRFVNDTFQYFSVVESK